MSLRSHSSGKSCYSCGVFQSHRWYLNKDIDENVLCRSCSDLANGRLKYFSKEVRSKAISQRLLGHKFNLGRKLSEQHKAILQKKSLGNRSRTGMKNSEYQKQRAREFMLGRPSPTKGIPLSDERKERYSIIFSGRNNPNYGNHYSEEIREKIRLSRLGRHLPIKDTSIEIALQKALKERGIKFETHKTIFGQPDIFIKPNICIFAD